MATIGDATINKHIRQSFVGANFPNTSLQRGVYGIVRGAIRSHMRRTLNKSRMLAKYVRNSARNNFTATDVAVVDYIRDLHDDAGLAARIEGAGYFDFLARDPKISRAEQERERARKGKAKIPNNVGNGAGPSGHAPHDNEEIPWNGTNNTPLPNTNRHRTSSRNGRRASRTGQLVNLSGHVAIDILPDGDCLFNSLGVAVEFVRSRVLPTNMTVARQEGLGGWARREIVAFLLRNKDNVCNYSQARRTTWEQVYEWFTNEDFERDVPVGRTYERYLEWLSVKGNWGDNFCILAGQEAFGVPVISNVVYRYPQGFRVTIGFSDDPTLPVISQATLDGVHYTLWLPTCTQNGRTSLDIGTQGRENVDLTDSPPGPAGQAGQAGQAGPNGPNGPTRSTRSTRSTRVKRSTGPTIPSGRPVRVRRKPVKLDNYVETVNLRSIDLKRYKKRTVPHDHNNLFAAVRVATGDARSVAELRRLCAESVTSRTFSRFAREYNLSTADLARLAENLCNRGRGIESDLYVLAHITRRCLVVREGRSLRSFQSPVASQRRVEPALLEETRFYNALVLET
jgi:hypothetical protein